MPVIDAVAAGVAAAATAAVTAATDGVFTLDVDNVCLVVTSFYLIKTTFI